MGQSGPLLLLTELCRNTNRTMVECELEGLGVVWAANHFRPYLYGHPCTVFTDHQAL